VSIYASLATNTYYRCQYFHKTYCSREGIYDAGLSVDQWQRKAAEPIAAVLGRSRSHVSHVSYWCDGEENYDYGYDDAFIEQQQQRRHRKETATHTNPNPYPYSNGTEGRVVDDHLDGHGEGEVEYDDEDDAMDDATLGLW
jgi:hypothetical protein